MNFNLSRTFFFLLISVFSLNGFAQSIIIDEQFDDWKNEHLVSTDPLGDGSTNGLDFENLWITNDDKFVYISFDVNKEILLQDYNGLELFIDIDSNASSGELINGIGADLTYQFAASGDRLLWFNNFDWYIDHNDVNMVALPTVSGERFELKFTRNMFANNNLVSMGNAIKVLLRDGGNDRMPDSDGGIYYELNNQSSFQSEFSLEKENEDDIRIVSLNVRQDGYFESAERQATNRLFQALNPDIIAFQEIYDHSAAETELQVAMALNVPSSSLYSEKIFPDIILVSKYPIVDVSTANGSGNGAFLVDDGTREWLFIVTHLPCCDNNDGRDEEVEDILLFIEEAKTGQANIELAENSPIVILGDMNFVGPNSQPNLFINGLNEGPDWGGTMEDANPVTTGEPANFTWYNAGSNFGPGRLDYVFYSGSVLKLNNSFNVFTNSMNQDVLDLYGLNSNDSTVATDHLAVVVDFDKDQLSSTAIPFAERQIDLYPNPVDRVLFLGEYLDSISVYSITGQKMFSTDKNVNRLFLDHLESGVYILEAMVENQKVSRRFIKN